jgi:tetratricopeptide (TPR) repeat protein
MPPQSQPQLLEIALACARRGDFVGMAGICRGILANEPNQPDALHCMGLLHRRTGNIAASVDCHERSVKGRPNNAEYRNGLGLAYRAANRTADSIDAFESAIRLDPVFVDAYVNVGQVYFARGEFRTAIARFRDAIERKPTNALLHISLARGLAAQGDKRGAETSYRRALALEGGIGPAYAGLGDLYLASGDETRALAAFRSGVDGEPEDPGNYLRAVPLLVKHDRMDAAIELLQAGLKAAPTVATLHVALARLLMRRERWQECWEHYARRLNVPPLLNARHRYDQPLWDGRNAAGLRICVHFEQSIAESLALLRYLGPLLDAGAEIVLDCPALIQATLAPLGPRITVCGPDDPMPPFDRQVWLASLPLLLKQPDPSSLPVSPPGLEALAESAAWRTRCADLPRPLIGLHWRSPAPTEIFDDPHALLAAFASFEGSLVALQDRTAAAEIAAAGMGDRVVHVGAELVNKSDIACEIAAAAAQCDLVVSVDSPIVQTAGLLHRPTLVLVDGSEPFPWPLDRAETAWFPTVGIVRKQRTDDDDAFLGRVRQTVASFVRTMATAG